MSLFEIKWSIGIFRPESSQDMEFKRKLYSLTPHFSFKLKYVFNNGESENTGGYTNLEVKASVKIFFHQPCLL